MAKLIESLINKHLIELKPYESARRLFSGGRDWLNANESPYVNDYNHDDSTLNRYPDCQPEPLIKGYANYANVAPENVLATRGADEGIELLIRTFCTPSKDSVLICPPTYGMYAISAETCNVDVISVPLTADYSLDVTGICAQQNVSLVFICAPNNPTGTMVDKQAVREILNHYAQTALVVLDEAYIEFANDASWVQELQQFENLVVLRTLSKAFALAGLRCGFTLASADIIQALLKVIAPYPVPQPVADIACQALNDKGLKRVKQQVTELNSLRQALTVEIEKREPLTVIGEANANFVLFRCTHKDELMAYLVADGVLIRDYSKKPGLENCLRATVGSPEQQARLLNLIDQFYTDRSAS